MDPITIGLLALLLLGGGGALWYEKWGPGSKPALPARQITLDANLPDADKNAIIAAIMASSSTPASLTAMSARYIGFPWAAYELNYRAWELNGSQGTPPAEPGGAAPTATPTPAAAVAAATTSQPAKPAGPSVPPPPPPPPPPTPPPSNAPSSGPFDLSHAGIHLAWQTDKAYIKAYQGALTFLAWRDNQPSWDPKGTDGIYGKDTKAAVMAFQTSKGITPVDGEAGKTTATAMAAALTTTQSSGQGSYAAYPAEGGGPGDTRYGTKGRLLPHAIDSVQGLSEDEVQELGEREVPTVQAAQAIVQAATAAAAVQAARPTSRPRGGWFVNMRPSDNIWPRKMAEIGSGVARGAQGSLHHLADINPHLAPGGVLRQFTTGDEINIPDSWATPLRQRGLDVRSDARIDGVED